MSIFGLGSGSRDRIGRAQRRRVGRTLGVLEALEDRQLMTGGAAVAPRALAGQAHILDIGKPKPPPKPPQPPQPPPPQAKVAAINFQFPTLLQNRINELQNTHQGNDIPQRKALLLGNALSHYKSLMKGSKSTMTAAFLANRNAFTISPAADPAYFRSRFNLASQVDVTVQPGLYAYSTAGFGEKKQFWVDFANKQLGGGVFSNGFVQEETMFLETPELADAAALPRPIITRTGTDPGVLQGSPTPWVFQNANRVMNLDPHVVGHDHWKTIPLAQLDAADGRLPAAQRINVLAMAAPKLSQTGPKASLPIVKDLFNTFGAGFLLARGLGGNQAVRVHTGPIGAGVFYNDRTVVYVMQRLAAQWVGKVNLTMWAYQPAEIQAAEANYVQPILQELGSMQPQNQTVMNLLHIAARRMQNL